LGFIVQGYSGGSGATAHLNFDGYIAYYLEAAPTNMALLIWGPEELILGLSQGSTDQIDWAIGRGRMNTAIIIAHEITFPYGGTYAASACAALNIGGKTDWFLPSKNELNALAQIRGQYGIPNSGDFWSSSQATIGDVWFQDFDNGVQDNGGKGLNLVHAVRAF
jgi:hypothetical protein